MDISLSLMCGTDIPIEECKLILHQPKIKEIAFIGERDFLIGVQTLCIKKNILIQEGKSPLDTMNNFQIFMTIMSQKETVDKKQAVQKVFSILFPQYKILFMPNSLVFACEGQENIIVDSENFESLQNIIAIICCLNNNISGNETYNPGNNTAKEIAEKLMRGRRRVAAQKGDNNNSIFVQYISILTIGINSMSLEDIINLTMYQFYDLIERYMLYVNWDIDIRSRMAGAQPDTKPDNWMKNIH